MQSSSRSTVRKIERIGSIGFVLLIVVGIAFFAYMYLNGDVTVTGTSSTIGFGTKPYQVVFQTNLGYDFNSVSPTAAVVNGHYAAHLANRQTYYVYINYQNAVGGSSYCYAGTLNLHTLSLSLAFDVSC